MRARQKTTGVEAVFTLTYEIEGEPRPACVADVTRVVPLTVGGLGAAFVRQNIVSR